MAREGNMMTFDLFQFVNNEREEEDPNSDVNYVLSLQQKRPYSKICQYLTK